MGADEGVIALALTPDLPLQATLTPCLFMELFYAQFLWISVWTDWVQPFAGRAIAGAPLDCSFSERLL